MGSETRRLLSFIIEQDKAFRCMAARLGTKTPNGWVPLSMGAGLSHRAPKCCQSSGPEEIIWMSCFGWVWLTDPSPASSAARLNRPFHRLCHQLISLVHFAEVSGIGAVSNPMCITWHTSWFTHCNQSTLSATCKGDKFLWSTLL